MPERITKAIVEKALRTPGRHRIADTQKGLVFRTRGGLGLWSLRMQREGRDKLLDFGTHRDLTADQARMLAAEAVDLIRRSGTPDVEWVARRRVELGIDDQLTAPSIKPTLAHVRADYLAWIEEHRRPKTYSDYRQTLMQPSLAMLMTKHMDRLQREDFAETIAEMAKSGKVRNAEKTGHVLSAMWSWATQDHRIRKTGATRGMLVGLKPPEGKPVERRAPRIPTPAQVKGLLARRDELSATIADAVTLLVFTAQRRLTISTARREDFIRKGQYLVWTIPASRMKAGREHAIPLPREVWSIVDRVGEGFLFPIAGDGHLSEYTLTHALGDLGVGFSPHDLRRGLSSVVRGKGFTTADVKLILDHTEGAGDDVTLAHYDFHADMKRKHAILRTWADALATRTALKKAA
ncbi:tyrosine-type recombinase/integrase [Aureimonas mangrovi]|uniref:tyrosine-type recombinase/integrase n=1 Tax=Aureimonas mangrovi TaxID=2758041 RepID=UPI00163D75A3|nr:integrase family protein [Aureimonas mangrovi]